MNQDELKVIVKGVTSSSIFMWCMGLFLPVVLILLFISIPLHYLYLLVKKPFIERYLTKEFKKLGLIEFKYQNNPLKLMVQPKKTVTSLDNVNLNFPLINEEYCFELAVQSDKIKTYLIKHNKKEASFLALRQTLFVLLNSKPITMFNHFEYDLEFKDNKTQIQFKQSHYKNLCQEFSS